MGMTAILINRPRPFVQIFNPPLTEGSRRNLKKIYLWVSEEKLFKGVDRWTTQDGAKNIGPVFFMGSLYIRFQNSSMQSSYGRHKKHETEMEG